jgi:hypothetical protein
MRILSSGAAAAAFALAIMSVGGAATGTMTGMMMHPMPHCTAKTGPVVWFVPSAKTYYLKGSSRWGTGTGMFACRATAVARGGHVGMAGTMGGSHGTMGGSHGAPMPMTMTMAPRPMSTGNAMASPKPMSSGNPMSGNQGNTGAPGAGGQVPNNPASSSNSNPSPRPSPRP